MFHVPASEIVKPLPDTSKHRRCLTDQALSCVAQAAAARSERPSLTARDYHGSMTARRGPVSCSALLGAERQWLGLSVISTKTMSCAARSKSARSGRLFESRAIS